MIVYTMCIVYELSLGYFAAVPFVSAVIFMWIYCRRSSDSAINDRCADLLRTLSLLFTEKAVSIVYPRQRPHAAL